MMIETNTPSALVERLGGIASATASSGISSIMTISTSRKLKLATLASRCCGAVSVLQPIWRSSGRMNSRVSSPRARNFSIAGRSIGRSWRLKLSTRGVWPRMPVSWMIVPSVRRRMIVSGLSRVARKAPSRALIDST